ncbi:unnamed protein product [Hymenolepis diminuta]|uniref:Uncharacterized protein n=1 Tax=Hymenolepis diminuta TaxID=6216 RepID=A0A564YXM8_HYMDI|nr:unnamed protein product [Hymenolepis diminuta]
MSRPANRFPLFYSGFVSHKSTSTLMLLRDLTQVTRIKLSFFTHKNNARLSVTSSYASSSSLLFLSTPPLLPLFVTRFKLVMASLKAFWSDQLLVPYFIFVFSYCSNSYEMVIVITVVIY